MLEFFPITIQARQQKEMSKEPAILITYQRLRHTKGMKPMLISIDGLLEYNLNDRQEATFEVLSAVFLTTNDCF